MKHSIAVAIFIFIALTTVTSPLQAKVTITEVERVELLAQIDQLFKLIQQLQEQLEAKKLEEAAAPTLSPVQASDHILGNPDAPVNFILYADYDDPFSNILNNTLQDLIPKTFSYDDVSVVFRHFPLTQLHPEAATVALVAECVAKYAGNEAFWNFTNDYFIERNTKNLQNFVTSQVLIKRVLEGNTLGTRSVKRCLAEEELLSNVMQDSQDAVDMGARGTPSSYVFANQKMVRVVVGAQPALVLTEILFKAIEQAKR